MYYACSLHRFGMGRVTKRWGSWEVIYSKERPQMTMLTDCKQWSGGDCWGWDSGKNTCFLSSKSLNEEKSFCLLQWWVIWSTSLCMKKFAILIKISFLSTNHYKILMKIGRFRFPVWVCQLSVLCSFSESHNYERPISSKSPESDRINCFFLANQE